MIQRCTNSKHVGYKWYGGRGVLVCEEWLKFENFLADMGERPEHMTLDRNDPEGNYELGNCTWVTWSFQLRNKRRVRRGEVS